MKWYNDMTEQEKRSFQKVIAVCVIGAILILLRAPNKTEKR